MAQMYDEALATIGRRIHHTFEALEDSNTRDFSNSSLENESQRFELWAANLGLYHLGHSSLDYRFRDAPSVFSFAYRLLRDLEKYLKLIKDSLDDEPHQSEASQRQFLTALNESDHYSVAPTTSNHTGDPGNDCSSDGDSEDEESFDSYQAQPLVELAIENTGHVIDRLYRLSFKVRNPATRMGFSKAKDFREIDPGTGANLIDRFADYDRSHVEEVFRHYRPKLTLDEIANHFLAQRLAKANTRRRQQFGQWRRHKTKLQRIEEPTSKREKLGSISGELSLSRQLLETPLLGLTAPSQPSTATRLDQNMIVLDDNTSVVSTSTYAIFSQESDGELAVPQFPKKLREKKEFQCPYCHVLCSRRTAEKQAWKTHVQRDLRPYVCTYSDCKEADQQYDSFTQWVAHETQAHGAVQHSPERRTNVSRGRDSIEAHQDHSALQSSRQCPICLETPASFDHIGLHLWNIAAFSLPRSTGIEDESDQGSTGSIVNDRQSQDSRLTNMKDLESLSLDEEQHDHAFAIADDREHGEAAHLTIEALEEIPDSLQNGVAINVSDYILFGQTTVDEGKTPDFDHRSRSDCSSNSSNSQTDEGKITTAEETLERYQKTLGSEHPSTLDAIATLGPLYTGQRRWTDAEEMYQRALQGYENILGREHEKTIACVRNLKEVYLFQNKLIEAESLSQQALESYEKIFGPKHATTIATRAELGFVYQLQEKHTEAIQMYQQALKDYDALDDSDPQGFLYGRMIQVLINLGKVYGLQGDMIESETIYQQALERLSPPNCSTSQTFVVRMVIDIVGNLGDMYEEQGRLVEAEKMYQRALKSFDALDDSDALAVSDEQDIFYRRLIVIHSSLGEIYRRQGDMIEAEKMHQQALKMLSAIKSSESQLWKDTWTVGIATQLGNTHKEQGKVVEAEEMYQQARQAGERLKVMENGQDSGNGQGKGDDNEDGDDDDNHDGEDKTGFDGGDDDNSDD